MHKAIFDLDDAQLMALTIWGEARGECDEGKIAVGTVILERVEHRKWDGETIKEVCLQKRQFSCFDERDPNYGKCLNIAETWDASIATIPSLNDCYTIALGLIAGRIPRAWILARMHCCQYLNPKLAPETKAYWLRAGMRSVAKFGNHEFFA